MDNLTEFTDCLIEVKQIETNNVKIVFMLGDYNCPYIKKKDKNAHTGELFNVELTRFSAEQS